ncbi:sulfide:quinone oxidoreductase, mitochondrial-like [Acanthaster planci]|uniref:Sulfide:quinone oxidoreductase, mitochondrial n=1 Tax=Acanthaster planci TaxID=133434 RepID=A0A8B7ZZ04_ACAPL|nr:sulfide:quinone oxidoreductase, mitochondrial-like [Acanthaster planci]XP_022109967.1 sulfide:quinone oxidoreductase, mitochondrial-like [Acanthaster planci]
MAVLEPITGMARQLRTFKALPWVLSRQVVPSTTHCSRRLAHSQAQPAPASISPSMYKFVVVGGGAGGLAMASSLSRKHGKGQVAVIEPGDEHFYQPLWTLVGGGIKEREASRRLMKDVMPKACDWIKDKAVEFDPENNNVKTSDGRVVQYDYLVVAMGLQLNFDQLKGLPEALKNDPMVCSNYSYDTVGKTFKAIQNFKSGNAIFTFPNTPVKCAGAPQKIMYLAEEYFRQNNKRDKANVMYFTPLASIFSAPKYAAVMADICKKRGIQVNLRHNLVEIKPDSKEVVFAKLDTEPNEMITLPYEMLHVPPPMGPPDLLKASPLAGPAGFLSVNKETGQHTKYPNVFGIGDCTDFPTSKTAAAAASQSRILKKTIDAVIGGLTPVDKYDGYTSCPLVTGRRSCVLAEFDYNLEPLETFPFDQGVERRTMYHMKADVLPTMYWRSFLKGWWNGPSVFRKIMHLGFSR